eukprot:18522-Pelagococcus_subviridis.AAC.20
MSIRNAALPDADGSPPRSASVSPAAATAAATAACFPSFTSSSSSSPSSLLPDLDPPGDFEGDRVNVDDAAASAADAPVIAQHNAGWSQIFFSTLIALSADPVLFSAALTGPDFRNCWYNRLCAGRSGSHTMRSFLLPSCDGACFTAPHPDAAAVAAADSRRVVSAADDVSSPPGTAAAAAVSFDSSPDVVPASSAAAFASTEDFSRRNMNGRHFVRSSSDARAPASLCRWVASRLCPRPIFFEYSLLNSTSSPSKPGQHKSYSAQSSARWFCIGVPVIMSRYDAGIVRIFRGSCAFGFLSLCPSSHTTQSQDKPVPPSGRSCPATIDPRPLAAAMTSPSSSASGAPRDVALCVTMPYVVSKTPPWVSTFDNALSRSVFDPPPANRCKFTPSFNPATMNSFPQCGSSVVGARTKTRFAAFERNNPAANAAT